MKRLVLVPDGWPCPLSECPPGVFAIEDRIGFKSEYHTDGNKMEAYCESGEFFASQHVTVQPLVAKWETYAP